MKEIVIAGISGSLRKNSYNTMLLNIAVNLLPNGVKMNILSIADIPLYNGDLDLPLVDKRPVSVQKFRDELAKVDGLLIATPEYNYSIPGVLKNALDWASRGNDSPLLNKSVSVMGASMGRYGTVRSQLALLPVFQFLGMKLVQKPEVLVAVAQDLFDEKGNLSDDFFKNAIKQNLEELKKLIINQ